MLQRDSGLVWHNEYFNLLDKVESSYKLSYICRKMEKLPKNTIDLLDKLEELYPDVMVTESISDFERGKRAGVIELLRFLKQLRDNYTGE